MGLVLTVSLVAGCGDDGPDESADPTPPASSAPSPSPTGSETPDGPAPATGPEVRLPHITLRVPDTWTASESVSFMWSAESSDYRSSLNVGDISVPGSTQTLKETAQARLKVVPELKMRENVSVSGVEMYHLSAQGSTYAYNDEYGVILNDNSLSLRFEFKLEIKPARRQEMIDSVLATVEFH